jgi:hypothetical protein
MQSFSYASFKKAGSMPASGHGAGLKKYQVFFFLVFF